MEVKVTETDDGCEIALRGDMTIYTAMQCKEEMLAPLQQYKHISVDMDGVYEIDTSGLQIIALFLKESLEKNIGVRFSSVSEVVQEFLDFCGLSGILIPETQPAAAC